MTKKNKDKEPEFYISKINTQLRNYKVYCMRPLEMLSYSMIAFLAGGCVGLVFYANLFMKNGEPTIATYFSNIVVFFVIGGIAVKIFLPIRKKTLEKKRQEVLRKQFREMLSSLNSSFSAGANIALAFESAYTDMLSQFGENAYITKELFEMNAEVQNNISVSSALEDFAQRSGIEDIMDFSTVFNICYQKGGNMKSVVQNSYELIGDKMAINEEIETKLTSNKMQQKAMSIIPIVMIAFLRISSSSFAESFASVKGILCMTIAIGIFIGSYLYGRKIINIKG